MTRDTFDLYGSVEDGEHIFDGEFYESCTVDGVHPNDLGFLRMGKVVGGVLHDILG